MEFIELNQKILKDRSKVSSEYDYFVKLMNAIKEKELPDEVIIFINNEIEIINKIADDDKKLLSKIKKSKDNIVKFVEKQSKFVPIKYYTKLWTLLGMSVFGLPFGASLALTLDNMGFIGIGFPFGMAIGMAYGKSLDNKALANGKQLNIEIMFWNIKIIVTNQPN